MGGGAGGHGGDDGEIDLFTGKNLHPLASKGIGGDGRDGVSQPLEQAGEHQAGDLLDPVVGREQGDSNL